MSEIKLKIQNDVKEAMKAREQHKLDTLRGLMSELKRYEIDQRADLTDEICINILQKEIKKRRDALEFAKTAGRAELVSQNEVEINLLQSYLGKQLDSTELATLIRELIAAGHDNVGKIMGALNQNYKGQFEGKVASQLVKEILG